MKRYQYKPIAEAPVNGVPVIAPIGGVEAAVAYDDKLGAWYYWDEEDDGISYQKAKPQPTEWRKMF